jgi:hypothetical protein
MTKAEQEKQKTQDLNLAVKAEINQNKVNIDRTVFMKTPEEKIALKAMKSLCK